MVSTVISSRSSLIALFVSLLTGLHATNDLRDEDDDDVDELIVMTVSGNE